MKRAMVAAALVVAMLFWLAARQERASQRARAGASPVVQSRSVVTAGLPGRASASPSTSAASPGPPAMNATGGASLNLAAASLPGAKPLPGDTTPAPPPPPGADDPGPGPWIERYEGRSGVLSPNATATGGEVTTRIHSTGGAPTLTVWVPTIRIQAGAEVAIHATLTDEQGAPVEPASIVAAVVRRGDAPGTGTPLVATDGEFVLRFKAAAPDAPSATPVSFD